LLDPRWQKKRLEIFSRDDWRCVRCGNNTETLHVHHSYYARNVSPWDYPGDCLSTLCETCHGKEHGKIAKPLHGRIAPAPRPYNRTNAEREADLLRWCRTVRNLHWCIANPGREKEYIDSDSPPTAEERSRWEQKVRDYNNGIRQGVL
jgi:hypothetical protein